MNPSPSHSHSSKSVTRPHQPGSHSHQSLLNQPPHAATSPSQGYTISSFVTVTHRIHKPYVIIQLVAASSPP
ncbi:oxidoreductase [Sesbania bispinosa]|nr:oxidoreductase [Sesbania bispinosa]